jgi:hypothetical protein
MFEIAISGFDLKKVPWNSEHSLELRLTIAVKKARKSVPDSPLASRK